MNINEVELAGRLADLAIFEELRSRYPQRQDIHYLMWVPNPDDESQEVYSREAEDIFHSEYDKYLKIIEECAL